MTLVIAEIGINHNGSLDIAKKLIDVVRDATNGLTDKLVASTAKASHAEGVKDERERAGNGG